MQRLVTIVGPTAVGKTKLSLILAKTFDGEIINGDAFQFYRGLDIGTAKITPEEMEGVPHHLIDILPPDGNFSVADFQKAAREKIDDIASRGKLPILVGGTGLYVKAVAYDYRFTDSGQDPELRSVFQQIVDSEGPKALHAILKEEDPEAAETIHSNNVPRVIRALEVTRLSGKPFSEISKSETLTPLYDVVNIGLEMERETLYERINDRVDVMIDQGLIEEAYQLFKQGLDGSQSSKAIGYKELFAYFKGEITKEDAITLIKQHSRQFAKRQFTWIRHQMPVKWFDMTGVEGNFDKKAAEIIHYVAGMFDGKSK